MNKKALNQLMVKNSTLNLASKTLIFLMLVIIALREFTFFDTDLPHYINFFKQLPQYQLNWRTLFDIVLKQDFYIDFPNLVDNTGMYHFEFGFVIVSKILNLIFANHYFYLLMIGFLSLLFNFLAIRKLFPKNSQLNAGLNNTLNQWCDVNLVVFFYFLWLFWFINLNAIRSGLAIGIGMYGFASFYRVFIEKVNQTINKVDIAKYFAWIMFACIFHFSIILLLIIPFLFQLNEKFDVITFILKDKKKTIIYLVLIYGLSYALIPIMKFLLTQSHSVFTEKLIAYIHEDKNVMIRELFNLFKFSLLSFAFFKYKPNNETKYFFILMFLILILFATFHSFFIVNKRINEIFGFFEILFLVLLHQQTKKNAIKRLINFYFFTIFFAFMFVHLK